MQDFNKILESLNNEQAQAVTTTEGPLLVLAGAGTGKTRVLTTRIAFILHQALAFPSQILAVTFTNKAAKEMEHRIAQMVGDTAQGLWIGTFHGICLKMIRRHYTLAGLRENFAIINQDDQLRLLKEIIKSQNLDDKRFNPKAMQATINRWKDRALTPNDVLDADDAVMAVYKEYQARCETLNVIDFGDLILKTIVILKNNRDVLAEYQRRFKYMLVDEYQDTNVAQYQWLRLLALANHNICCVGDDDQSIYGWRGAEVGNILRFEKDFDGAKIIRLETNYRSTADILAAADCLISNNESRLGKTLRAHHGPGQKVRLASLWDDRGEATYIADEIESLQQTHKQKLDDVAILVRAGYQTRAFEECFLKRAIPYRILGGLRFYERMEIRDAIAYMRAIYQSDNDLALERIINTPKRGLGDKTIDDIKFSARANGITLNAAIRKAIETKALKPKIHETLSNLMKKFDEWRNCFSQIGHVETVKKILDESGYINMWKEEKTIEAKGRVENLMELSGALAQFRDIDEFLEHVSLVADSDDKAQEDMVSIMTIHGAKGLEFENLFLPGWEEGLFPSQQTIDELGRDGLEEERRLAYVAITRAKKRLTISFSSSRMVFGNIISSIPSRFIDELPKEHIEAINNTGRGNMGPGYKTRSDREEEYEFKSSQSRFQKPVTGYTFEKPKSKFSVGDKVTHPVFGFGRVLNVNGQHVQIVFEKAAIKTLLEDFIEKAA